ncbi:hypothetical protein Y032_0124g1230 [Ancylostoma ceylanicum]|uniref:Uncharacterized protein n=1 Tax=Ancylostoma ceylanicum TaxID=53326 RepID=A0A016T8D6_9BILA|nr:hypothetical protein Y032_0124g1230 [Ancylostoma ceylanicum]
MCQLYVAPPMEQRGCADVQMEWGGATCVRSSSGGFTDWHVTVTFLGVAATAAASSAAVIYIRCYGHLPYIALESDLWGFWH